LGFAKVQHKITPEEKVGIALGAKAPQNLGVLFNISVMAKGSEFKFGIELGFAKSN